MLRLIQSRKLNNGKHSLFVYWSKDGDKLRHSTGYVVEGNQIDKRTGMVKSNHPDHEEINLVLVKELSKVNKAISELPDGGTIEELKRLIAGEQIQDITGKKAKDKSLVEAFDIMIGDSERGIRMVEKGGVVKPFSPDTIKNYRSVRNSVASFAETKKKDLTNWEYIQNDFHKDFCDYCWNDKKMFDNSTGKDIRIIKTCINYYNEKFDKNISTKKFKRLEEKIDVVWIEPEELKLLLNFEIKEPHIEVVRDIFVFGCTVLQRVGDLLNMMESDVERRTNTWVLKVVQEKTNTIVEVPLHDIAKQIIMKYEDRMKGTGWLLPHMTDVHFNRTLKEVIKLFGIYMTEQLEKGKISLNDARTFSGMYQKIRTRGGKAVKSNVDYSSIWSSHCMRRTGITNLLILGMPEYQVKQLSGHSEKDNRSFSTYVGLAKKHVAKNTQAAWDKVFS